MSGLRPNAAEIVVAGHICLDIIPAIPDRAGESGAAAAESLLIPGKLIDTGPALLSTGGAVSNTGLALYHLGFPVKLAGKVGDDPFGGLILQLLQGYGSGLADGMIVASNETSSYTVVINPPGVDRIFLHCTGANDTFGADDLSPGLADGAKLFHFGYPPLMRKMYEQDGAELERLLSGVKSAGMTVSLDLARPDPESAAGKVNWRTILARALPHVDVFLPSFEEILYMLRPDVYRELGDAYGPEGRLAHADGALLARLADELLDMGAAIAGLKLGEYGFYVKTTPSAARLQAMGPAAPAASSSAGWLGRELIAPCYRVEVVGTTGAGDCAIAGFLGGLLKGLAPEEVLLTAAAVGASSVERADAVGGVRDWDETRRRMAAGWRQSDRLPRLEGWTFVAAHNVWEKRS